MVDIIIPVYNALDTLELAVTSALMQGDVRILLVDDGSTDGCGEVCDKYAARDERVRVIHQENQGLSAARNAGIETVVVEPAMFPNDTSYDMAIRNKLKDMDIELVINAGFYPGVGRETARSFHNKVIAVQPSLIPAFETLRGDAVHEAVLARGLKVTGATAYLVDENGGVGPVLLQKAVPVLEDDDLTTLKRRVLTDAEWKLLPEAVKRFCAGKIRLHGGRAQLLE